MLTGGCWARVLQSVPAGASRGVERLARRTTAARRTRMMWTPTWIRQVVCDAPELARWRSEGFGQEGGGEGEGEAKGWSRMQPRGGEASEEAADERRRKGQGGPTLFLCGLGLLDAPRMGGLSSVRDHGRRYPGKRASASHTGVRYFSERPVASKLRAQHHHHRRAAYAPAPCSCACETTGLGPHSSRKTNPPPRPTTPTRPLQRARPTAAEPPWAPCLFCSHVVLSQSGNEVVVDPVAFVPGSAGSAKYSVVMDTLPHGAICASYI